MLYSLSGLPLSLTLCIHASSVSPSTQPSVLDSALNSASCWSVSHLPLSLTLLLSLNASLWSTEPPSLFSPHRQPLTAREHRSHG
jgi:hypothetical protein